MTKYPNLLQKAPGAAAGGAVRRCELAGVADITSKSLVLTLNQHCSRNC